MTFRQEFQFLTECSLKFEGFEFCRRYRLRCTLRDAAVHSCSDVFYDYLVSMSPWLLVLVHGQNNAARWVQFRDTVRCGQTGCGQMLAISLNVRIGTHRILNAILATTMWPRSCRRRIHHHSCCLRHWTWTANKSDTKMAVADVSTRGFLLGIHGLSWH